MIYIPPGGAWFWALIFIFAFISGAIKNHANKKLERTKKLIYDEALQIFHEGELTMDRKNRVTTDLTMKYLISREETNTQVFRAFMQTCEWRGIIP